MHTRLAGSMLSSHLTLFCFVCPLPCPALLSNSSLQQPLHSCYLTHIASWAPFSRYSFSPVCTDPQLLRQAAQAAGYPSQCEGSTPMGSSPPHTAPLEGLLMGQVQRRPLGAWQGRGGGLSPLCRTSIQFPCLHSGSPTTSLSGVPTSKPP